MNTYIHHFLEFGMIVLPIIAALFFTIGNLKS